MSLGFSLPKGFQRGRHWGCRPLWGIMDVYLDKTRMRKTGGLPASPKAPYWPPLNKKPRWPGSEILLPATICGSQWCYRPSRVQDPFPLQSQVHLPWQLDPQYEPTPPESGQTGDRLNQNPAGRCVQGPSWVPFPLVPRVCPLLRVL